MRFIKLAIIVFMSGLFFFSVLRGGDRTFAQENSAQEKNALDVAGFGLTLPERVGADDGALFAIQFLGDLHGSLDNCGCKGRPAGGFGKRVSYQKAFKEKLRAMPVLMVDSGEFLNDDRSTHGELKGDARIKNDWVLKAYDKFPVEAANVSAADVAYISQLIAEDSGKSNLPPILQRTISANIVKASDGRPAFKPFVIRTIGRGKQVKVAIVGLSELSTRAPAGLKIVDPLEAARLVVPQAARAAEVVVVLAHVKSDVAARIAAEVPGISALIVGNGELFTPSIRLKDTLIAFTPSEGRMMGELRFYAGSKISVKDRFISLDGQVPDDPEGYELVVGQREARKVAYDRFSKPPTGDGAKLTMPAGYAGSQNCSKCHVGQYVKWANSDHALSSNPLATRQTELESSCFVCHGGVVHSDAMSHERPLGNVGCEICHGPGAAHVAAPDKSYGRIADAESSCARCHTAKTSPKFNFSSYLAQVKH